ncbi:UNVERIFIED_CONTAM: hypothetical protein GTU68_053751 [Idotea baltica]|nr:hypothetical protein [Idotea baltica]
MVEQNSDQILEHLKSGEDVCFLVGGDPFGATTHTDIILASLEKARDVVIANNACHHQRSRAEWLEAIEVWRHRLDSFLGGDVRTGQLL